MLRTVSRSSPLAIARAIALAAPMALVSCGSSSSSVGTSSSSTSGASGDSGVPPFTSGDGGLPGFSVGTSGSTSGASGASTTGTTVISGSTVTTIGPPSTSSSPSSSSSTLIPSSGVAITVEPDGSGDASVLLSAIQNAKVAVHVEMYLLTNSTYINALEGLSKKIDVKVLLNQTFPSGSSAAQTNASSYSELQSAGVNVKWAPADPNGNTSGYTHEKAVIIDPGEAGEQVWIMTMNLDTDAPKYNREYLAQDTSSADVTEAEAIFEHDFNETGTFSGNLVVSPINSASELLSLVESATSTIDMEAEEIDESGSSTEEPIFNALTAKARSGVAVHLVLEDSSEATQSQAVSDLESAGGKVVGYSCSGNGLDIHAKAVVVDGATSHASVYVGSENFTGGSLGYNRELGVIFSEASEVAKVYQTIQTDFANGATYSAQCSE